MENIPIGSTLKYISSIYSQIDLCNQTMHVYKRILIRKGFFVIFLFLFLFFNSKVSKQYTLRPVVDCFVFAIFAHHTCYIAHIKLKISLCLVNVCPVAQMCVLCGHLFEIAQLDSACKTAKNRVFTLEIIFYSVRSMFCQ